MGDTVIIPILAFLLGLVIGIIPYIVRTARSDAWSRIEGLEGRMKLAERSIIRHGASINAITEQLARMNEPSVIDPGRINRQPFYMYPSDEDPTIIEYHGEVPE